MTTILLLSGPAGSGKSTTAQLMAREAGYVYYEADCIMSNVNPFIPLDAESPTIAALTQKPLKVSAFKLEFKRYFVCLV